MSGPKTSLFAINSHFLGGSVSGIRRYNNILLPALFSAAPALLCQKDKRSREGGGDAPACFPSKIFREQKFPALNLRQYEVKCSKRKKNF